MIENILSPQLVEALGWTLVHTLWQAAVFALLLGVLLVALRKFSANARYVMSVSLLACFFLTVGITFASTYRSVSESSVLAGNTATLVVQKKQPEKSEVILTEATEPRTNTITTATNPTFLERTTDYYQQHLPLIVTLWLLGVLVLQLRFLGQLAFIQRLKNYGTERFPTAWAEKIGELEDRMRVSKPIRYLTSYRVESPLTVGWLRPVILFPTNLLESLKEEQIAAILAHEIAHVQRYDFLVNLVQTILCSLFFYHPGVWWMSSRIAEEREHCCDDLAIRATGRPVGYAGTLVQLQEQELGRQSLAMAFLGKGGFKARVQRLLGNSLKRENYAEGFTSAFILFLSMGLSVLISAQSPAKNDSSQLANEPVTTTESAQTEPEETAAQILADEIRNEVQTGVQEGIREAQSELLTEVGNYDPSQTYRPGEELELLIRAILNGDEATFNYFIERVEDLNEVAPGYGEGFTPLMAAAHENQYEMARKLIERGADVNAANTRGWTALIEAADEGGFKVAKLLVENGADINRTSNHNQRSAIVMAASEGHVDILRYLLANGGSTDGGTRGPTALQMAAEEGQLGIVRVLVEEGAEVNELGNMNLTALALAASEGHVEVVRYLMDNGAEPTVGDHSPLHLAAEDGHLDVAEVLLEAGMPVNIGDRNGQTALMRAAADNHGEVVRMLLDAGADPQATDARGRTALAHATEDDARSAIRELTSDIGEKAMNHLRSSYQILHGPAEEGHLVTVASMLSTGIDIDITDEAGNTALSKAAEEGHLDVVKFLLEEGASVNRGETTPLRRAVMEGQQEIIRTLLSANAKKTERRNLRRIHNTGYSGQNMFLEDYDGASLLFDAIDEEDARTLRLLLGSGGDPNVDCRKHRFAIPGRQRNYGDLHRMSLTELVSALELIYEASNWTPLMEAVEKNERGLVRILVGAGANISATNSNGDTALDLAKKLGYSDLYNLLE